MKLKEVAQELIPAGETPREVEGELLAPTVRRSVDSAAKTLADAVVDDWWKASQKAWAGGMKDDPEYRGKKIGDFLADNMGDLTKRTEKIIQELDRRVSELTYEMSVDRSRRWRAQGEPRLT